MVTGRRPTAHTPHGGHWLEDRVGGPWHRAPCLPGCDKGGFAAGQARGSFSSVCMSKKRLCPRALVSDL
jgi:hypothetical protein